MKTSNLTTKQATIVSFIHAGATSVTEVAKKMKTTTSAASQAISRIEANGGVRRLKDGTLKATAAARRVIGESTGHREGTKAAKADEIIAKMRGDGAERKDIIVSLVKRAKLTEKGAATYISNWDRANPTQ